MDAPRIMMPYLPALFLLLSGAASLIYQVTWVRLLSLSIGSTSVSVGIVLATFFSGLALGSYLTTRLPAHRLTSLRPYLIVEAIIGVSALLLLPLLLNLDQWIATWPVLGEQFAFKVGLVMAILALPSICIGATYPLMVSLVVREPSGIGRQLGWLYSMNTVGAVMGAAGSGFLLIPWLGLDGAIYVACGLNAIVVALGMLFSDQFNVSSQSQVDKSATTASHTRLEANVLLVLFLCGMVALASQVAWTKYLSIFVHTTIYGFSALLSITLLGIALGAWWMKRRVDALQQPVRWLIMLLFALALVLLITRIELQYLPSWYDALAIGAGDRFEPLIKYALIAAVLLPPNLLFGALFTLNMRQYCGPLATLPRRAGSAYAINTVGGVLGSLLAGLWLIPYYGTDRVLVLMTGLIAIAPLLFLPQLTARQHRWLAPASAALLLAGLAFGPALDYRQMITSSLYAFDPGRHVAQAPEFRFIEEGRAGVISVTSYDGQRLRLQNNSLPEALVTPPDAYPWLSETLLGVLPYLLHPRPEQVFIVGLGAGTTLSAATLTPAASIRVVELEPAVAKASQVLFKNGLPALSDPRVELVFDDARHRLLLGQQRYDVIISQPSHPWLMGSGNLFTREYFQLVSSRLKPGGVSVQWVNLFHIDAETLQSILQAYFHAFPQGMTFIVNDEHSLLLVGANDPLHLDPALIDQRLRQPAIQQVMAKWRIDGFPRLLDYFALSRADALRAAGNSRENTDTALIPEMRSSRTASADERNQVLALLLEHFSFDVVHYLRQEQQAQALNGLVGHLQSKNDMARLMLLNRQRRLSLDQGVSLDGTK